MEKSNHYQRCPPVILWYSLSFRHLIFIIRRWGHNRIKFWQICVCVCVCFIPTARMEKETNKKTCPQPIVTAYLNLSLNNTPHVVAPCQRWEDSDRTASINTGRRRCNILIHENPDMYESEAASSGFAQGVLGGAFHTQHKSARSHLFVSDWRAYEKRF